MLWIFETLLPTITVAAGTAWAIFKFFATPIIESIVKRRLALSEASIAREQQIFRHQLDALLEGVRKVQDRDYTTLPRVWASTFNAYREARSISSPAEPASDISTFDTLALDNLFEDHDFPDVVRSRIRERSGQDRNDCYAFAKLTQRVHRANKVVLGARDLVEEHSVLMDAALAARFQAVIDSLMLATVLQDRAGPNRDRDFEFAAFKRLRDETAPQLDELRKLVRERLEHHAIPGSIAHPSSNFTPSPSIVP